MLGLELNSDTVVQNGELNESLLLDANAQADAQQPKEEATLTLQEIEKLDAAAAGGETTPADGSSGVLLARLEDRTGAEVDINTDLRDTSTLSTLGTVETAQIVESAPIVNSAPTINASSIITGAVTETGIAADATAVAGVLSATGTLTSSDVDADATATWTRTGTETSTYGTFALGTNGAWTYDLLNNASVDSLKQGQIVTETYAVKVSDGLGGVATQTVTITINGTNDADPTLTVNTHNIDEASGKTVSDTISFTHDIALVALTINGHDVTHVNSSDSNTFVTIIGNEGTLVINGYDATNKTISYSYTEDGNSEIHNSANNNIFDEFVVYIKDIEGDSVTENLKITINDDVPTIIVPDEISILDAATSPNVTRDLNFSAGADGVGNVTFDITNGQLATDSKNGAALTYNGKELYLYYGTDESIIYASTASTEAIANISDTTTTGFWIDINPVDGIYTMHSNGIIGNGTAISAPCDGVAALKSATKSEIV